MPAAPQEAAKPRGTGPSPAAPRPRRKGAEANTVKDASYATALAMYREYSKYPPNSRPVDETYSDIAEPLMVSEAAKELPSGTDALGRARASGIVCLLQPARHTVSPAERQRVTLSCRRGSSSEAPAGRAEPLVIERVTVSVASSKGDTELSLGAAAFRDDGSPGDEAARDGTYTLVIPIEANLTGLVNLTAHVKLAEGRLEDPLDAQPLRTSFTIAPKGPARFTGKLSDAVRNGSLIVSVEVEVEKAGRYRLFANLEHGGELIAYAKEDRDLAVGRQTVDLLFFGKILRDAAAEGRFLVTNVRGQHFNLERMNEGLLSEPLEPILRAHETAAYRLTDFSGAEWDSDYKRERIAELTALAERE